jgi:UDP-N-acetylglucosamine 2-epimerase (non-hydrolysing)
VSRMDLMLVAGARPNFVKLAPLYHALRVFPAIRTTIVHTGQHYDDAMSGSFFRELEIPEPEVNLEVGPGSHGEQTGRIMILFEPVLQRINPRWVVVFGDVNSTVACALVAAKLGVAVAHVEAGLRSNDWSMPEEINRLVTDRLSTRLYAPSQDACDNLMREGIAPDRVRLVGNIMVDTLLARLPKIDQERTLSEFRVERQRFVLVTLHRPSNVDDPTRLFQICSVLGKASEHEPVLFPAHPRTQARLQAREFKGALGTTRVVAPLPYHAFLGLMASARAVVTDSGGIQEETTALGVPCLTLRPNTERPITITQGTNQLVEPEPTAFRQALETSNGRRHRIPELWDGRTAERIAADLDSLLAGVRGRD